jgi:hypothetical protein
MTPESATVDLSRLTFVFAKTMPTTPHEYVVRTPENEADYVALFRAVREHGVDERFQKRRYHYWYAGDGWKYWAMTTDEQQSRIINRAKVDDAREQLADQTAKPLTSFCAGLTPEKRR